MVGRRDDVEAKRREKGLVRPEALHVVDKPWGRELWWAVTDRYLGKRIEVRANHMLSLQYHREKLETLYLLSGRVRFHVDGEVLEPPIGSALTISPGTVHRIEAVEDAVLFEVSTPHPDDVVRLDDRYGRADQRKEGSA
ncbi:MAG TPA: cupin domain-containing protein [bacterium]|nr:cupin domain-containing protein [bacterium]